MAVVRKKIYQIYYDHVSLAMLDAGFIPLDNSKSQRPDWFEFYPMLNHLNHNELEDGVWYGFLSPKFRKKTGYTSSFINNVLDQNSSAEVALFSHSWDQAAYFKNPWEQGEYFHQGLMAEAQNFLDQIKLKLNLDNVVSDSSNTVYSNFLIAKKKYWEHWRVLANQLYEFAESHPHSRGLQYGTKYGLLKKKYEMKVFVQERLPTLILHENSFKTVITNNSKITPIFKKLFKDNEKNIRLIEICGDLKNIYGKTQDQNILDAYLLLRNSVELNT
jgi:hypothetical protein